MHFSRLLEEQCNSSTITRLKEKSLSINLTFLFVLCASKNREES